MARVMGRGGWRPLPLACHQIGQSLRGRRPQHDPHELAEDTDKAILAEALTAAVCHGTNWDSLRNGIIDYLRTTSVPVHEVARLNLKEFSGRLGPAFTALETSDNPEDEVKTRFRMFQSIAAAYGSNRLGIADGDGVNVLQGDKGLFAHLQQIPGFGEDPERKKMRVFAQNLIRFSLVSFIDEDKLPPAVEYHILRLYLRTGRVVPETGSALRSVTEFQVRRIDSVTALRRATADAMRITAESAEMTLVDLNDVEWQIGRSLCLREGPRCGGPPARNKPIPEYLLAEDGGCPLRSSCAAASGSVPKSWTEPRLSKKHNTHY